MTLYRPPSIWNIKPGPSASINHPIGFRGRCQATTSPTTAKATAITPFAPPAANGFCRAASDSGTNATVRSTVSPASVHAVVGRRSHESQFTGHPPLAVIRSSKARHAPFRERYGGAVTLDQLDAHDLGHGDGRVALPGQGLAAGVLQVAVQRGIGGESQQLNLGGLVATAVPGHGLGSLDHMPVVLGDQAQDLVFVGGQIGVTSFVGPQQDAEVHFHESAPYRIPYRVRRR